MHMDPALPMLVGSIVGILVIALLMHRLNQPNVVAYLVAGIVLGPSVLGVVNDQLTLDRLGEFGVIMLMFFIGMEVSPDDMIRKWRLAVIGVLLQVSISVFVIGIVGFVLDWPLVQSVLLGFVISLSSTAVILNLLQSRDELASKHGQDVLTVLLAQDIAVIPMLIVLGLLGGDHVSSGEVMMQITGGILLAGLCVLMIKHPRFRIPLMGEAVAHDREFQVFGALLLCFGMALITAMFSLSAALGAFVAGMVVAAAKETKWVHHSLEPFKTVFVALFFVSIGMLVDMNYLAVHWWQVLILTILAMVLNTVINAGIFRLMGDDWQDSLYSGAILSQIGEFSFVLVAVGASAAIIEPGIYQLVIAVIATSLLLSPLWIAQVKKYALNLSLIRD